MKSAIVFALVFFSSHAGAGNFEIRDYKPIVKNMRSQKEEDRQVIDFTMPLMIGNSPAARRINTCLYFTMIERMPPESLSSPLDNFDYGLMSIAYDIIRNDSLLLSLSVKSSGCGVRCNENTTYFNFDAKSGRYIAAHDLFNKSKVTLFTERLFHDFEKEIIRNYHVYNNERSETKSLPDSIYYDEQEGWSIGDFGFGKRFGRFNPHYLPYLGDGYSIRKDRIVFTIESLNKYFDNAIVSYPVDSLRNYLSDYGKHIVLGSSTKNTQPFSVEKQVFNGYIGEQKIVFFIKSHLQNEVDGLYYYEKNGKPVVFYGEYDGKSMVAHVSEGVGMKSKTVETIRVHVTDSGFSGIWTDNRKTVKLLINLP